MVRPKSIAKKSAPSKDEPRTPILGKRRNNNGRKLNISNQNGTNSNQDELPSKRLRKSTMPYQAPESITSILKAVTPKIAHAIANKTTSQDKTMPLNSAKKSIPPRLSKGRIKDSMLPGKATSTKNKPSPPSHKASSAKQKLAKKVTKNIKKQLNRSSAQTPAKKFKNNVAAKILTPAVKTKKSQSKTSIVTNGQVERKQKGKKVNKDKSKNQKDDDQSSDAKGSKAAKKRKSKKETLNPKPHVTLYEMDPLYHSKSNLPHISTLAHSRLVIRAVIQNDIKYLKQLITKDASLISSLCVHRSVSVRKHAIDYAMQLGNKEAIKLLMSVDDKALEKFGSFPDLMLQSESTGQGSYKMFGHALRTVAAARGGLEGNGAFLNDSWMYNVSKRPEHTGFTGYCPLQEAVRMGLPFETFEMFASTLPSDKASRIFDELTQNIHEVIRAGNNKLAGKLLNMCTGYGYNNLHTEVLNFTDEPLTPFKSVSVIKKPYGRPKVTPVHCAAINPNPNYLQSLLNSQPAFTILDTDSWSPVHYASVCSGEGPLKLLISKGISTLGITKEGDTPLHLAISRGRLHNVKLILETEKAYVIPDDPSTLNNTSLLKANKAGMKPLHLAAQKGNVEIVKALLDAGLDGNQILVAQYEKLTPLMVACQNGHLEVVKLFVEYGVKLELGDKRGKTAICHAVINGSTEIVSYLLRLGVNHEAVDSSGNTLVHYAAAYGWYFILKLLEEAGCNMQAGNMWKLTPMSVAFMKGHIGIVEMLAKLPGVDIDSPIDADERSLLLHTCSSTTLIPSLIPRLKFLIDDHKSDCKKVDINGNTCLHLLVNKSFTDENEFYTNDPRKAKDIERKKNLIEAIKFLLDRGCDINALNDDKTTPLQIAADGNMWLVQKLVEMGSKLTTNVSDDGNTLLHLITLRCISKHPPNAKSLCDTISKDPASFLILKTMAGMRNKSGHTPLLYLLNCFKSVKPEKIKRVTDFIKVLISTLDSDVQAKVTTEDKQGKITVGASLLHILVCTNYFIEVLPIILAKKVDIDPLDENMKTPLTLAILSGESGMDKARALIKAGADVNFKSKTDWSVGLLLLLGEKQPSLFDLIPEMVSKGANITEVHPKTKNSILHYVARNPTQPRALDAIKAIISAGVNVNVVNVDGRTPLHLVVNSRGKETDVAYDIEDALISAGADLTIKDCRGRTPLHYAFVKIGKPLETSYMDPIELVMLLGNGITDTNSKTALQSPDAFGATALHYAAMRGSTICCSYLMSEMNGDIDIPDNKGNTPFGLTVYSGHEGCALHFQQHGGDFLKILDTNLQIEPQGTETTENNSKTWEWEHNILIDEESKKRIAQSKRYPIFQEVVNKDWQGILFLMIGKLKTLGTGMSSGVSTALKTNRLTLALKLITKVKSHKELDQKGENLIHTLAKYSKPDSNFELQKNVLQSLVSKGISAKQQDDDLANATIYAAMNLNHGLLVELTSVIGEDFVAKLLPDSYQRTPFSALFWNIETISDLSTELKAWIASVLKRGATPNILTQYQFVLSKYPGIRSLRKCDKESKKGPLYSPLITAVIHGKYDLVKWLSQLNINSSLGDSEGRTALMHAVRLNDLKMVKLLLNPKSYNVSKDVSPWTVKYPTWKGEKATYLEINSRDKQGWTAADYVVCPALEKQHYSYANVEPILTILYKVGSSFTTKSGDNLSPLERAILYNRLHIVNIMESLMKTPLRAKADCTPQYSKLSAVTNVPGLASAVDDYTDDAKKVMEAKSKDNKDQVGVLPDPLLNLEADNSEVVTDQEQNIPFDCIMTKVDISYGMYGLYNFYKMQVVKQPKGKELIFLFTQWGRVGDTGQYQKTPFVSVEEATKEFKKIFRAKSGNSWENVKNFQIIPKKYRLVKKELSNQSHEIKVDFDKLTKSAKANRSVLKPEVYEVIKQISLSHMQYENRSRSTFQNRDNLPVVAKESLKQADTILKEIRTRLEAIDKLGWGKLTDVQEENKTKIIEELVNLSEEFYTLVPVYGFATEKLQPMFDFHSLRERQEAIYNLIHLGFAKELLLAAEHNSATTNPFEYIYRSIGAKLKLLNLSNDLEREEAQLILQNIQNTSDQEINVKGIYRVQRSGDPELEIGNRWFLWHGSKSENLLSILHGGLQISPLGISLSGNLFGKGIYFADMFEKAQKYSTGTESKFILLCEVALGKISDVTLESATQQASKTGDFLPAGYDSLKTSDSYYEPDPETSIAWKGRTMPLGKKVEKYYKDEDSWGLYYNEYIVFNPNQVNIRYMVQFT